MKTKTPLNDYIKENFRVWPNAKAFAIAQCKSKGSAKQIVHRWIKNGAYVEGNTLYSGTDKVLIEKIEKGVDSVST